MEVGELGGVGFGGGGEVEFHGLTEVGNRAGLVADVEAVDHAVGEERIDLYKRQVFSPLGERGIAGIVEFNCDGIGGVADVAASGLGGIEAGPSRNVDIGRGGAGEGDTEVRGERPMAVGAGDVFSEAAGDGEGGTVGVEAKDS
jgi:hypothetical protein